MKQIDLAHCLLQARTKPAQAQNEKVRSAYSDLAVFYERQLARTTNPRLGLGFTGTLPRREDLH